MTRLAPPATTPAQISATAHVFVDRLDDHITVEGDDGHHLQRARRVRPGETLTAADGYGRWRVFAVTGADAGRIALEATSALVHEAPLVPRLTVACALTKGEKPELAVQKLTELGVDRILVVQAARSVVQWDDAKAATAFTRLQRVARARPPRNHAAPGFPSWRARSRRATSSASPAWSSPRSTVCPRRSWRRPPTVSGSWPSARRVASTTPSSVASEALPGFRSVPSCSAPRLRRSRPLRHWPDDALSLPADRREW